MPHHVHDDVDADGTVCLVQDLRKVLDLVVRDACHAGGQRQQLVEFLLCKRDRGDRALVFGDHYTGIARTTRSTGILLLHAKVPREPDCHNPEALASTITSAPL